MAQRLVLIAIDGSDHSEKAFQCTSSSAMVNVTRDDNKVQKRRDAKNVL